MDHYGTCTCGEGAELTNGVCGCPAGLILDASGTICYDGIDSTFDQTQEGFHRKVLHKMEALPLVENVKS